MIMIDSLCCRSRLRDKNAGVKSAFALITLVICIAARFFPVSAVVFVTNGVLTVWKGKIPASSYVRLLLVPAAFLLAGMAVIIVNISDVPMDAFAIPAGRWYLTGSRHAVLEALELGGAAMASVTCLYFLALNTSMTDILGVLRALHCPSLLTELMMLIYRFIFLLMETASALMTAQEARLGNRNLRTGLRSFGMMGTALFLRSLKRANALYDAMEARCYDGEIRVLARKQPAEAGDILLTVLFEAALTGVMIWSRIR